MQAPESPDFGKAPLNKKEPRILKQLSEMTPEEYYAECRRISEESLKRYARELEEENRRILEEIEHDEDPANWWKKSA